MANASDKIAAGMTAGFVEPEAELWHTLLAATPHDIYHLPGYVRASARVEEGRAVLFVAREGERQFLVPLVVRPIPLELSEAESTWYDATSPYGYPGPLVTPTDADPGDPFLPRAVASFVAALRDRRIVSCFVRLHPLFPLPIEPLQELGDVVRHGDTVSIDLRLSLDLLWRQTRHNHRRDIAKGQRSGQIARMDPCWAQFDSFVTLYHDTMRRINAADFYFFSSGYLNELRAELGDRLHLCLVEVEGRVAAAGMFSEYRGIVQYHLSGTHAEFTYGHPLKTMIHFISQWARDRGNTSLHLGGGVGGRRDSLFDFKAGFSPLCHPFYTWRIVANAPAYFELLDRWSSTFGASTESADGFFPGYRRPHAGASIGLAGDQ
jgi:hypothetical protein